MPSPHDILTWQALDPIERVCRSQYWRAKRLTGRTDYVTPYAWRLILDAFDWSCTACLSSGPIEMSHLTALSRGGKHLPSNVVPLCSVCNRAMGTHDARDWFSPSVYHRLVELHPYLLTP